MAGEFVHPLEMLEDEESKRLKIAADKPPDVPPPVPGLQAQGEGETPPAEPPAETPAETPPATDQPPAETPPAETPAAETPAETPPAETPAETPPPQQGRQQTPEEDRAWKQVRLEQKKRQEAEDELFAQRRRIAELERRILGQEQPPQQLAADQLPPGYVDEADPLENVTRQISDLKQQMQTAERDRQLNQEANAFSQQHPDYPQAFNYYIENEVRAAEQSGEIDTVAMHLRNGDQNMRATVANVANVRQMTEADAAREVAKAVLFEARKSSLIASCQQSGRSVVETIYNLAHLRGFNAAAPAPPPEQAPGVPSAAQEQREEQRQAAAASVSSMTNAQGAPPRRIRTRADFNSLPPEQQAAYVAQMDAINPNWHQDLS